MVQAPSKIIALDTFLQQPETKPASEYPASEYIDGRIIQKLMPKAEHSGIQTDLAAAINAVLRPEKEGRAFSELRCTFGDRSIVPDITVLPWLNLPKDEDGKPAGELLAAPDWMIEILSPGQHQTTVTKKILRCLEYGNQMG